jgi:DNA modification methylase
VGRNETIGRASKASLARRSASVRRFEEVDWDFGDQFSDSPFSDLHWHPCRFPSQIPSVVIGRLSAPGDAILDPFAGSGTTLVEAQRLGRAATGIDINPIACMMARAKTLSCSAAEVTRFVTHVKNTLFTRWDEIDPKPAPPEVQREKWYTRNTVEALERLWGYIHSHRSDFDILLKTSFSAVLLPACRETRHWGYICDNSQPKSDRERDVRALFNDFLARWDKAYKWREQHSVSKSGRCDIIEGDAASILDGFRRNTFASFVTSPPYFGVTDYVKSQRLSMEWFGFEIERARLQEIGARSKRHRLTADVDYVDELVAVFERVHRVLKDGSWGVIVFGQSPKRVAGKAEFITRLKTIGFRLELEKLRQIREMRRQFPSVQRECVLLIRKT